MEKQGVMYQISRNLETYPTTGRNFLQRGRREVSRRILRRKISEDWIGVYHDKGGYES